MPKSLAFGAVGVVRDAADVSRAAVSSDPKSRRQVGAQLSCRGSAGLWDRVVLEKEVWAEPIRQLTTKYGVSDVSTHKQCKKMVIEVPGRGYWAKKEGKEQP
jgi:hypothetical protein